MSHVSRTPIYAVSDKDKSDSKLYSQANLSLDFFPSLFLLQLVLCCVVTLKVVTYIFHSAVYIFVRPLVSAEIF